MRPVGQPAHAKTYRATCNFLWAFGKGAIFLRVQIPDAGILSQILPYKTTSNYHPKRKYLTVLSFAPLLLDSMELEPMSTETLQSLVGRVYMVYSRV